MPILKLFVGGGVPDAPADFAWLQFGVLDGIYDWFVGRGLDPSFAILLLLKVARGVEDAAPYGLHVSWRLPGAGGCKHPPLRKPKVAFGPGGVNRRGTKKREETCSTPARFSFFIPRPPLWGS